MNYYNSIKTRIVKSTKSEISRGYIVLASTLIFTISIILFVIYPLYSDITIEAGRYSYLNSQYSIVYKNYESLLALSSVYSAEIQPNLSVMNIIEPDNPSIGLYSANINAISKTDNISLSGIQYNVNINQILPQSVSTTLNNTNAGDTIYISITGSGTSQNIRKFLSDITNFPRITTIYSMNIFQNVVNGNAQSDFTFSIVEAINYKA